MACKRADFVDVRQRMRPGDVIAFSGKGNIHELIKSAIDSDVTHVAVVLPATAPAEGEPAPELCIIESTTLYGGVAINPLGERLASYDGAVWWLPLGDTVRARMDLRAFQDFLLQQEHKPYDVPQAIKSALDRLNSSSLLGRVTYNVEDFSELFCSELIAAALEASGAISHLNASEVAPQDLCMFSIYQPDYYQLKGEEALIEGYNTLSPEGWGDQVRCPAAGSGDPAATKRD